MTNEWLDKELEVPVEVSPQLAKVMQQNIAWQVEVETDPLLKEMHKVFENLNKKQEPLNPEFAKVLNENILDLF